MDRKFTEELDFDDNGLKNAYFQASLQEIASSDRISENFWSDFQLSNCDAVAPESCATPTREIEIQQGKHDWKAAITHVRGTNALGESSRIISGLVIDEQNKTVIPNDGQDSKRNADKKYNLDGPIWEKNKNEAAENVLDSSSTRSGEVETKKAKFRSGRSAKDGGLLRNNTHVDILSSLVAFCVTSFATITSQFSISLSVGMLILMPSVGVEGGLTSRPANTLYVVGKTARMNCSTDLNRPVYWARTLAGSGEEQWLYYGANGFNGNNVDGRYTIDKDATTGRYDVVIEDVQSKDAGRYACVDDSGVGARASAELIVSAPINCTSRIPSDGVMGNNVFGLEQGFIQVSCSLTNTGNLQPTLEWSWPGSEMDSDEPMVFASTTSVTSTLKLSPTKERDNATFQCKANIEGATSNAVDSGLMWESKAVGVKYAEFASEEVDVCPGISWNLFCNPQCSYHFDKTDEGCRCVYKYYDSGTQQNYQVASDIVKCNDNDNRKYFALIGVVLGVAALIAAIPFLFILAKKKKKQRRPAAGSKESDKISIDIDENSAKDLLNPIRTVV